jgi:prepilin-type N-terminal cleavage/methylation domain-containing protein
MLKRNNGFTYIEMIVVFAVIAILLAIAVPLWLADRRYACDTAAQEDLRNIIVPWQKYVMDEPNVLRSSPTKLADLAGPYYGWSGSTARCTTKFYYDTSTVTVYAAAEGGSRPAGATTRYMYFMRMPTVTAWGPSEPEVTAGLFWSILGFFASALEPTMVHAQQSQMQVIQKGIVDESQLGNWVLILAGVGCSRSAFDSNGQYLGCQ